jgi:hypothetical protein
MDTEAGMKGTEDPQPRQSVGLTYARLRFFFFFFFW